MNSSNFKDWVGMSLSSQAAKKTTKVSIVGAGSVGSTMAYALLMRGIARTVALYDIDAAKVRAEALDLAHGIQFTEMAEVLGSDDIGICENSDVVIVTAGAKQRPGQSRIELAAGTTRLVSSILPKLLEVAPNAIYIMVTNPVDVVTYAALKVSGLPSNQLFGSGTVLDSSRLRYLLAAHCGVAVQNVHAYMAGEHGDSEFPLWSSATIGGVPLLDWQAVGAGISITEQDRSRIAAEVVDSAYQIIAGKGATNYAVGLAGASIAEAVLANQHRVLPVSTLVDSYYGISDVCLSVPTIVDANGAGAQLPIPMSAKEVVALQDSANQLRLVAKECGF